MRFDGLRLYAPFHLKDFQSLFSAIDPRIVDTVDVYTGGFARALRRPHEQCRRHRLARATGAAVSRAEHEFLQHLRAGRRALRENRGEWLASARRSNLDVWYHALSNEPGTPSYSDAFSKVSYRLNDHLRLTASALLFTDEISLSAEDQEERANAEYSDRYLWLRIEQQPNAVCDRPDCARSHTHAEQPHRNHGEGRRRHGTLSDARSFAIESLQTDWSWRIGENWLAQFGGEVRLARGTYDYRIKSNSTCSSTRPERRIRSRASRAIRIEPGATHYAMYAAFRNGITPRLTTDVGLRWESQLVARGWACATSWGRAPDARKLGPRVPVTEHR